MFYSDFLPVAADIYLLLANKYPACAYRRYARHVIHKLSGINHGILLFFFLSF